MVHYFVTNGVSSTFINDVLTLHDPVDVGECVLGVDSDVHVDDYVALVARVTQQLGRSVVLLLSEGKIPTKKTNVEFAKFWQEILWQLWSKHRAFFSRCFW